MAKPKNKVVSILMRRDGLTEKESKDLMAETIDALESGDMEAMSDYLGLEDDYIFDILF